MPVPLTALPDVPDVAFALAPAPEFAALAASPEAIAAPVFPDGPELPDLAVPPKTNAPPRMALLDATGLDVAEPVLPVLPEFPETATGLLMAVEMAGPVRPVFVALDSADEAPVLPAGPAPQAETEAETERRRAPLSERLRRVLGG